MVFPDWRGALSAEGALGAGQRAVYQQVIVGFLDFCAGRGLLPTVALAREHLELRRLERAPGPGRLQGWKDALNWFFRRGRAVGRAGAREEVQGAQRERSGVPPLARSDLGGVQTLNTEH